jgi:putative transposase
MKYNPDIHHRRSIRLKGYDYSQNGAYFVTICTQNRECLFGEIMNGEMVLNDAGEIMKKWWLELENKFPNFGLDVFVVMPNHFHGIIVIDNEKNETEIVGADLRVCPDVYEQGKHTGSPLHGSSKSQPPLSTMIQWFKTMTTNEYIRGVKTKKFPPFEKRIWQRNYHEHIIRNEKSYETIQNYIINNPAKWQDDTFFVKK